MCKCVMYVQYYTFNIGLTTHVVTRWYRAPEVILLNQTPSNLTGVDVWSVGCIFAELLQMVKKNCPDYENRGPLFPGDSCFPLSPKRSKKNKNQVYQSHFDQIRVIFDVLGSPTQQEINKLEDEQARQYLEDLPQQDPDDLKKMFPATKKVGIDLLKKMLKFTPEDRITVPEALKHPYFKRVRDRELEITNTNSKFEFEDVSLKTNDLKGIIYICFINKILIV